MTVSTWRTSAGLMKGTTRQGLQNRPREGTKIGNVYDAFMTQPLTPLSVSLFGDNSGSDRMRARLVEDYGLDIRLYSRGGLGTGKGGNPLWWLVGYRDNNGSYVDFLAQHMAAAEPTCTRDAT